MGWNCCNFDEDGDQSEKRRWWVRIGITLLILILITGMVLASVFYRETKSKGIRESLRRWDEEEIDDENVADHLYQAENLSQTLPMYTSGSSVFAEHSFCAETGSKVLHEGGSAVDAAVAMLLCQGVVEPHHSGLGGGFLMMVYIYEKKQVVTLDAREMAPSQATARMFETPTNNATVGRTDPFADRQVYCTGKGKRVGVLLWDVGVPTSDWCPRFLRDAWCKEVKLVDVPIHLETLLSGWLTVAVPGEVMGLWEAHQRYGKLPWQRLVDPAIRLASFGFPISNNLAKNLLLYNQTVKNNPSLRYKVFIPLIMIFVNPATNEMYQEGDNVMNEDLAKVLMRFAAGGAHYWYKGKGAKDIFAESVDGGGILQSQDFAQYSVKWSNSLSHVFRDSEDKFFTLYMPPPPSCAMIIGMILNIVGNYEGTTGNQDINSSSQVTSFYHKIVEAMKHSYARRNMLGDSAQTKLAEFYSMLRPHWGRTIRGTISPTSTFGPHYYLTDAARGRSSALDFGATNIGIVSTNGDAVVASSSLNDPFGAGIVSESLGFLLNNRMLSFTKTKNGNPEDGNFENMAQAGKRPLTTLSPVMILDDHENLKLLMAASGGIRIPSSIVVILMRYFWLKKPIGEATLKLRFHHQLIPNVILYEGANKEYNFEYLRAYGHEVMNTEQGWPHVNSIVRENGTMVTTTDPRENI